MIQVDRQQFQVVATSVISLSTNFVLFQVGETAHLTCSVQTSSPPSELSWFINDEPVSKCIYIIILSTKVIIFVDSPKKIMYQDVALSLHNMKRFSLFIVIFFVPIL